MKKEMKKKNNKGFSLVELIVVIAIMAVLMVVLAPAMLRYVEKTRIQKDDSAVSEVRNALELTLADDSICSALNYGNVTVTVTGSNGVIQASGATGVAASAIADVQSELDATTKADTSHAINITSKDRKGKTYTVTATWSDTLGCYELSEGAWN